jgi:predicted transcriptional regulator
MSNYKEDIIRLRNEGKSYGEISEILGCSKGTVAYYLKDKTDKPTETVAKVSTSPYTDKVIAYINNIKGTKPCVICGQYLHQSQLDALDGTDIDKIVATVFDKESLGESKRKIGQLKFICANCDRLRQFKLAK